MDPYEELLARREELETQIAALRASRRPEVIAQIGRLMHEYEIGVEDLTGWQGRHEEGGDRRRGPVAPRYVDPRTGATWSGRGKRPRWMGERDPDEFLIRSGTGASPPPGPTPQDELTRALYGTAKPAAKGAAQAKRARGEDGPGEEDPGEDEPGEEDQPALARAGTHTQLAAGFPSSGSLAMQAARTLQGFQSTIRRTK
jgi:DNA-binding protein H-NS